MGSGYNRSARLEARPCLRPEMLIAPLLSGGCGCPRPTMPAAVKAVAWAAVAESSAGQQRPTLMAGDAVGHRSPRIAATALLIVGRGRAGGGGAGVLLARGASASWSARKRHARPTRSAPAARPLAAARVNVRGWTPRRLAASAGVSRGASTAPSYRYGLSFAASAARRPLKNFRAGR
jgi:hypothetical protein